MARLALLGIEQSSLSYTRNVQKSARLQIENCKSNSMSKNKCWHLPAACFSYFNLYHLCSICIMFVLAKKMGMRYNALLQESVYTASSQKFANVQ